MVKCACLWELLLLVHKKLRSKLKVFKFDKNLFHNFILEHFSMLAHNHNTRLANVIKNGFVFLGRCIPSLCSQEDLMNGWYNFLQEAGIPQDVFTLYPINCHTVEEKSKELTL